MALQEALGLPRVRLVLEAVVCPTDHAVEDEDLLRVVLTGPQAASFAELVLALQAGLQPVELGIGAHAGDIILMHTGGNAPTLAHKYAGEGLALREAYGLQEPRILLLPSIRNSTNPLHVLLAGCTCFSSSPHLTLA